MERLLFGAAIVSFALLGTVSAARGQDAEEMARKLQDPLANIKALMTDNDVLFNTGKDETSYSFQLQPVYAVPFEDRGFNLINRAIIPILGMAPLSQKPILDEPVPPGDGLTWGLSDIVLQWFVNPRTESAWKWGVGPQVSLKTRTDDALAGSGWGGGIAGVLVGNVGEQLSTAFVGGQLWGQSNFSTAFVHAMLFYNIPGAPGMTVNYSNVIAYDWSATSGNEWTVPLGLGISKTIATQGGLGIDFLLGYYYNVEKPAGAADQVLKWGVTVLFP